MNNKTQETKGKKSSLNKKSSSKTAIEENLNPTTPTVTIADPNSICYKCKCAIILPNNKKPSSTTTNNKKEMIIKCKGDDCRNKCHLSCATIPPKSKVYSHALKQQQQHNNNNDNNNDKNEGNATSASFSTSYLCDNCNVEGSSRYLMEYFEDFLNNKQQYHDVSELKRMSNHNNNHRKKRTNDTNHTKDDSQLSSSFLSLLVQQAEHMYKTNSTKPSEINLNLIWNIFTKSNRSRKNSREERSRRGSTLSTLSNASNIAVNNNNSASMVVDDNDDVLLPTKIDESILIGKPIRLYNPVDNTYHIGRIIDSRPTATNTTTSTATSSSSIIPSDFLSTEYLVRFREGMNQRKVAVHQWIILEEHALSIAIHLIWATTPSPPSINTTTSTTPTQVSKKANIVDYKKPAQIMLRSALEMIPIKRDLSLLQKSNLDDVVVFCLFFNQVQSSIISILQQSIPFDFHSSSTETYTNTALCSSTTKEQKDNDVGGDSGAITLAIAMACMEYEEQRRIRAWHKLSMVGTAKATNVEGDDDDKKDDDVVMKENQQRHLPNSIILKRRSR